MRNSDSVYTANMQAEDLPSVVNIYMKCFPNTVNVALGSKFVRTFCKQALEEDFSLAVVLKESVSGRVIAVAVGTLKPGYTLRVIRKHFFLVCFRVLYGFIRFAIVRRKVFKYLFSFIRRPFKRKTAPFVDDSGVPLPGLTHLNHQFVAVRPECHGRGYGTIILSYLVNCMFEKGAERIVGSVSLGNTPSLRLHKKLGWRIKQTSSDRVTVWITK